MAATERRLQAGGEAHGYADAHRAPAGASDGDLADARGERRLPADGTGRRGDRSPAIILASISVAAPTHLPRGTVLGRYEIEDLLGMGELAVLDRHRGDAFGAHDVPRAELFPELAAASLA